MCYALSNGLPILLKSALIGVGVSMDNMLYIIAALVIILLLTVLVMRKRQAQKLTFLDGDRKIKNDRSYKGFSNPETKPLDNKDSITKFDNVTIAERFMDQQRYDKAIETLKRGLAEKPHDGFLLLKLLNVYVVANQYQDFDRVYHALQTHGDQETIEQADQLRELISNRHTTSLENPISKDMSLENSPFVDFANESSATVNPFFDEDMSLDFDSDQLIGNSQPTVINDKINLHDNSNDSFNLTLDDLEAAEISSDTTEDFNTIEDNSLLTIQEDEVALSTNSSSATNVDDDFTLDFEALNEQVTKEENDYTINVSPDSNYDELNLSDDFDLDLESYAVEGERDISDEAQTIARHNIENSIDEFNFILEDDNFEDVISPVSDNTTHTPSNDLVFIDSERSSSDDIEILDFALDSKLATDGSVLDDISPTDASGSLSPAVNDEKSVDDELLFDDDITFDDIMFDDNNGLEAVTDSFSPVNAQKLILTNNLAPVALDAVLSTDFDYVKTLNSYQVTLELADHYLQLGEYDSAKRLLTEVVNQGNSEQQQKAKMLLARTA